MKKERKKLFWNNVFITYLSSSFIFKLEKLIDFLSKENLSKAWLFFIVLNFIQKQNLKGKQ